ncbi:glycosyltransferase [Roseicyclus persicicus]|uniref:Glycosyltransferase n=1 Tax=Roseicyclus persicicus TaxID=2650661 RepID=A0A7X6H318_9RHOB|nr:glycosyltransferase [Roseibacterium persicicum]NKX45956.1 glycosyltransferase [Roseibacterium persicicum]
MALFSYRHDAAQVPGLIANLSPCVHGFVGWDDRAATVPLSAETTRRTLLLDEARRLGADWILAADPDERFEDRLAQRMPEMLAAGDGNLWYFDIREMFTPDSYRCDGVWGGKAHMRLFPMRAVGADLTVPLHGNWIADTSGFTARRARVNIYHFRMALPARRRLRRELYAAADPDRLHQEIGYDYLDDERGLVLEPVPEQRRFSPPFEEDGGLWSPDPAAIGQVRPDTMEARLAFAARSAQSRGAAAAYHVLDDLCAASPGDADLAHAAATLALQAGLHDAVTAITTRLIDRDRDDLLAIELRARARLLDGQRDAAGADLADLRRIAPDSLVTLDLAAEIARPVADFTAPDALWRRRVAGPATCREGAGVARSDLAVVVIGLGAPAELADAVASLRAQEDAAEIVVVNSGGGRAEAVLAAHLDAIRLIEVRDRLMVGAARNIGIDASRAGIVGFLAGDCRAGPGWVAGRLARHRAGALSVSSPVLPLARGNLVALAVNRMRYWARSPGTHPADVLHFGRSYDRRLFWAAGNFPPGLRVSEDDVFNTRVDRIAAPVWAPEVHTAHVDPTGLLGLWRDARARGRRRADHAPLRAMAGRPDVDRAIAAEMARWSAAGRAAVDRDPALGPLRRRMVKLLQGLARISDRRAAARRLGELARADALLAEADRLAATDPGAALAAARAAAQIDPQDWRKAHRLGELLAAAGHPGAETAWRDALALSPGASKPLKALVLALRDRAGPCAALAEAQRAALAAPSFRSHWTLAAEMALAADQPRLAIAHGRRALALGLATPAAHARLARLHEAAGTPLPAMFRDLAARRLADRAAGGSPN